MAANRILRSATQPVKTAATLSSEQRAEEAGLRRTSVPKEKRVRPALKRKPERELQTSPKRVQITTPIKQTRHGPLEVTKGHASSTSSLDRPAEPYRTNVPLVTPKGSHLVAYSKDTADMSPSRTNLPRPRTTIGHILEEACAHLVTMEPKLKSIIKQHHCRMFSPEGLTEECDPFKSLASGIMAQQVSGAAASSIKRKFVGLFQPHPTYKEAEDDLKFPTPEQVALCSIPFLRQAGLSERKAEYIQGLAAKFANGELSAAMLVNASDEEIMEKLTAVRGLGRWSVEMFACFGLKRMDILSTGDLGVQRGMAAFMGKDVSKLKAKGGGKWKYMSEKDMLEMAEKFAPYRSVFMWYMWRVEGVDVNVVEES
ncbi:uncharacterized protein KY384_006945 [Bacidia gigantensis]|uniref:uncharacterized protein n=1 Tax=Bacidia gigantensis TaxID=2732470 RepID=UPI001D047D0B|nr:uncharacterized protein KY384_006945 [Bacidia gigantensis]KAG8528029.1 hypothetical protein KY384_006945 [Bacidia gigantensis]